MSNPMKSGKNLPFNRVASGSAPEADTAPNAMALVIDVQDFARMDADDARNYAAKLAENLVSLREQNVPVTWVTMRKDAQLYEPQGVDSDISPQVRDIEELKEMGFHGVDPEHENHEIFRDFLLNHGPRTDEAVSVKSVKSALVEKQDALNRPEYQKTLESECGEPLAEYFDSGKTLPDYMRDKGINNTILMGAVSSHCVSETAVSAAIKGFNPQIATDTVLSWHGDESQVDPQTSLMVWRGTTDDQTACDKYHTDKINKKIVDITSDQSREFTSHDMDAIFNIDYISPTVLSQPPYLNNSFGAVDPTPKGDFC